ncbi:hypothetical protein ACT7DH_09720 [Bacillus pacificus]
MNYAYPDEKGHYGIYGGRYVPETLMQSVLELEEAYKRRWKMKHFKGIKSLFKNITSEENTAILC